MTTDHDHLLGVFTALSKAFYNRIPMIPRSEDDKEFFAQDWFKERLEEEGIAHKQNGRNSYPDFLVPVDGFELKALEYSKGKAARKDLDFNSTLPVGYRNGRNMFLLFFLYEGKGANPRTIHSLTLAHLSFINTSNPELCYEEATNFRVPGFGSYGDGFVRNRKMYVFPHPVTLEPSCLEKCCLIVPKNWGLSRPKLKCLKTIKRSKAREYVSSYTIDFENPLGGHTTSKECTSEDKKYLEFDVFEIEPTIKSATKKNPISRTKGLFDAFEGCC